MDFIFVHINKTGGSSIEAALGLRFRHRTAAEIIAEVGIEAWRNSFSFTVVRNPWDRVVSHFSYRVDTNQTGLRDAGLGFPDWVRESYGNRNPLYYDNPLAFMPQVGWISDLQGQLLVSYVARFENLQADFEHICARIGRDPVELPHRKQSSRGHYRDYYDPESRAIVTDWFRRDIERFGYEY